MNGLRALKNKLGLDPSIAYTAAARILQGAGSIVTVLLLVHFLTPAEQGYYYTFWSLVALQVVFELGFSFVILQTAAHERAHLQILADGTVTGSKEAQHRLALILQLAVRWYLIAAAVMGTIMLAAAMRFFALHASTNETQWVWPLRVTVLACCATFSIGPIISFLEGSGMVTDVARMRLMQSFVASGLAWVALITHHGLYSPAMVLTGQGLVASMLVVRRHRYLLPLLRLNVRRSAICWRKDIWPFQWKIAVSWMSDYFIFQLFTPVLFAFRGPIEAGQMGLSMSAVTQLGGVVLSWMSTKAVPFGILVAQHKRATLDRLFFRTLRQSTVILVCGALLVFCVVVLLPWLSPQLARRIVSWPVFLLLLLTGVANHVVQSLALYLRAHKVEPFLWQSIAVASAIAALGLLVVRPWGTIGITIAYFIVLGVGGSISGVIIFSRQRALWNEPAKDAASVLQILDEGTC